MYKLAPLIVTTVILTSCARLDYHGMDPQTYNEVLYPKTNTVKHSSIYHSFYFAEMAPRLDTEVVKEMDAFLSHTYPEAAQRVLLTFGMRDPDRELYVTRLLRARGFKKSLMEYTVDETIHPDELVITMDYSYAETPRCPDWRKNPLINYSNTNHSNFGCSTATNFAKQVANPHDLVQSATTRVSADSGRDALAIGVYRTGEIPQSSSSSSSGE